MLLHTPARLLAALALEVLVQRAVCRLAHELGNDVTEADDSANVPMVVDEEEAVRPGRGQPHDDCAERVDQRAHVQHARKVAAAADGGGEEAKLLSVNQHGPDLPHGDAAQQQPVRIKNGNSRHQLPLALPQSAHVFAHDLERVPVRAVLGYG
jgi:hypothetical protein